MRSASSRPLAPHRSISTSVTSGHSSLTRRTAASPVEATPHDRDPLLLEEGAGRLEEARAVVNDQAAQSHPLSIAGARRARIAASSNPGAGHPARRGRPIDVAAPAVMARSIRRSVPDRPSRGAGSSSSAGRPERPTSITRHNAAAQATRRSSTSPRSDPPGDHPAPTTRSARASHHGGELVALGEDGSPGVSARGPAARGPGVGARRPPGSARCLIVLAAR